MVFTYFVEKKKLFELFKFFLAELPFQVAFARVNRENLSF